MLTTHVRSCNCPGCAALASEAIAAAQARTAHLFFCKARHELAAPFTHIPHGSRQLSRGPCLGQGLQLGGAQQEGGDHGDDDGSGGDCAERAKVGQMLVRVVLCQVQLLLEKYAAQPACCTRANVWRAERSLEDWCGLERLGLHTGLCPVEVSESGCNAMECSLMIITV
jgi:hypothetical protein